MTTTELKQGLNEVEMLAYNAVVEYLNSNPTVVLNYSTKRVSKEIAFEWSAKELAQKTVAEALRGAENDSWVYVSNYSTAGFCAAWDEIFPIVDKHNNRDFSNAKFQIA